MSIPSTLKRNLMKYCTMYDLNVVALPPYTPTRVRLEPWFKHKAVLILWRLHDVRLLPATILGVPGRVSRLEYGPGIVEPKAYFFLCSSRHGTGIHTQIKAISAEN